MALENEAKFKEKPTCGLKNDRSNLTIFLRALKSLKIATFIRSFYPKYKMYELKIYKGVMCYYNGD